MIPATKICNRCKKELPEYSFSIRPYKNGTFGLQNNCKLCMREYRKEQMRVLRSELDMDRRLKLREKAFKKRLLNPEKEIWERAQKRAKKKGQEFNIEIADIIIPEYCPILEIPIKVSINGAKDGSPSLDRINQNLGYVKGNVRVISRMANIMKAHATKEQLETFIKNMPNYLAEVKLGELRETPEMDNPEPS